MKLRDTTRSSSDKNGMTLRLLTLIRTSILAQPTTALGYRNASKPNEPNSRPTPECFETSEGTE